MFYIKHEEDEVIKTIMLNGKPVKFTNHESAIDFCKTNRINRWEIHKS